MTLDVNTFGRCTAIYETDSADDWLISMRRTWQPYSGCVIAPEGKANNPKGSTPRLALFWSYSEVLGVQYRRRYPVSQAALSAIESLQRSGVYTDLDGLLWTLYGWQEERRYERTFVR